MNTPGEINNGVLIGNAGFLFLAGGAHSVFDIVTGRRQVSPLSFETFAANIHRRSRWASNNSIEYLHVIFPDKQSIISHHWPLGTPIKMGQLYLDFCRGADLPLLYPDSLLSAADLSCISKVDTHVTSLGTILVASQIVSRLTGDNSAGTLEQLLQTLKMGDPKAGDLGVKLDPQIFSSDLYSSARPPGKWLTNDLASGNNGIVDIRFCSSPVYDKRLVIFGDSFGRELARFLQFWFREVLFFRSQYFHQELAEMCRPDYLLTQNVERYLDSCKSDDERPSFFMYPHLRGVPYNPSREFASTFSSILSTRHYDAQISPPVIVEAGPLVRSTELPEPFRSAPLKLQDGQPDACKDLVLEASRVVGRTMPIFFLNLSGVEITPWLLPEHDLHSSNLVQRRDMLVLGPNLQFDQSGRWGCESRAFKDQFLDLATSPKFHLCFPGAKPRLLRTDNGASLDFREIPPSDIQAISVPVFLATPLEPDNWGRWVKTAIPKLVRYREHPEERHLFCHARTRWQKSLIARLAGNQPKLILHDPGRIYLCTDVQTIDFNVGNMTVSADERSVFTSIARESSDLASESIKMYGTKIFVSRLRVSERQPNYRVLQNERELADRLETLGFATVVPELMSFDEQVALFCSARVVVFVGGAAIYNSVFCSPGTVIVTLESSTKFLRPHCDLLSSLNHAYGVIVGRQDPADPADTHKRWSLDIDAVCQKIIEHC